MQRGGVGQPPALRLLLQAQLDQVVQGDRVVLRGGALRSVGGRSGGAVRHAPGGHALPDAGVHPGPRHLQSPQRAQREGNHIQQAAVGATQLLKQHLDVGSWDKNHIRGGEARTTLFFIHIYIYTHTLFVFIYYTYI